LRKIKKEDFYNRLNEQDLDLQLRRVQKRNNELHFHNNVEDYDHDRKYKHQHYTFPTAEQDNLPKMDINWLIG